VKQHSLCASLLRRAGGRHSMQRAHGGSWGEGGDEFVARPVFFGVLSAKNL